MDAMSINKLKSRNILKQCTHNNIKKETLRLDDIRYIINMFVISQTDTKMHFTDKSCKNNCIQTLLKKYTSNSQHIYTENLLRKMMSINMVCPRF